MALKWFSSSCGSTVLFTRLVNVVQHPLKDYIKLIWLESSILGPVSDPFIGAGPFGSNRWVIWHMIRPLLLFPLHVLQSSWKCVHFHRKLLHSSFLYGVRVCVWRNPFFLLEIPNDFFPPFLRRKHLGEWRNKKTFPKAFTQAQIPPQQDKKKKTRERNPVKLLRKRQTKRNEPKYAGT